MDQDITWWALQGRGPRYRDSSSRERKRFRSIDRRMWSEEFTPRARDASDLAWFFSLGEDPPQRYWSAEKRKRYRRVSRCLDGRGYHLMQFFLRGEVPDRQALLLEYRAYVQNTARPYAANNWERYLIVERTQLEALVQRPPRIVVIRDDRRGRRYLAQRPAEDLTSEALQGISRSTWGRTRVDADDARFLLEWSRGVSHAEASELSDHESLDALQRELDRFESTTPKPESTEQESLRERRVWLLDIVRQTEDARDLEQLLALARRERRFLREEGGVEPLPGRAFTNVSELARLLMLPNGWVRRALVKQGCPSAATKRGRIPVSWLDSDRGRDFRARAQTEINARNMHRMRLANPRFSVTSGYR